MAAAFAERYYFLNAEPSLRHHLHVKPLLSVCFAAICSAQITATPADEDERLFEMARQRYFEAVDGDKDALDACSNLLHKLWTKKPEHPLVSAYLGSTRLLEAARAMAPWKKGKLAKEGLRMLDRAVEHAPENLEIRFLRAVSTSHLPGFFRRQDQSAADLAWLAPRVGEGVASGNLDPRLAAASLYHYGLTLEKSGDIGGARRAWREAARLGSQTRAGADARRRLSAHPEDADAR